MDQATPPALACAVPKPDHCESGAVQPSAQAIGAAPNSATAFECHSTNATSLVPGQGREPGRRERSGGRRGGRRRRRRRARVGAASRRPGSFAKRRRQGSEENREQKGIITCSNSMFEHKMLEYQTPSCRIQRHKSMSRPTYILASARKCDEVCWICCACGRVAWLRGTFEVCFYMPRCG